MTVERTKLNALLFIMENCNKQIGRHEFIINNSMEGTTLWISSKQHLDHYITKGSDAESKLKELVGV